MGEVFSSDTKEALEKRLLAMSRSQRWLREGLGADEAVAAGAEGAGPAARPRVARRTSPRSLRSRGRRAPRAPEFPHGAFALFGEFRLNEEAGLR